jgi:hypothetical protein
MLETIARVCDKSYKVATVWKKSILSLEIHFVKDVPSFNAWVQTKYLGFLIDNQNHWSGLLWDGVISNFHNFEILTWTFRLELCHSKETNYFNR